MIFFWESVPPQVQAWVVQEIFQRSLCQTQKEFGKKIGKSRSHVTNMLRGIYPITEKSILTIIQKFKLSESEFEEIIQEKLTLFQDQQRAIQSGLQYVFTGNDMIDLQEKLQLDEEAKHTFWQTPREKIGEFVPFYSVLGKYAIATFLQQPEYVTTL